METETYQVNRTHAQFRVPFQYKARPDRPAETHYKVVVRTRGETIDLSEEDAAPFLAEGVIGRVGEEVEPVMPGRTLFSAPRPERGQSALLPDDVTEPTPTVQVPGVAQQPNEGDGPVPTLAEDAEGNPLEEEDMVEEELDLDTSPIEKIAAWIKADRPSIRDLVEATERDPVTAARLLEAERMATSGSPRRGALRQLQAIIDSAESRDDKE